MTGRAGMILAAGAVAALSPLASFRQPQATSTLRAKLRAVYRAETGIREATGKNDGARVEEYLRYAGLKKGDPWCAAFVCWSLGKAGIANPRTGWSPDLFKQKQLIYVRSREIRNTDKKVDPDTGDVFGIWFPELGRIAHTGFIDQWGGKWVVTVEGNTNTGGSRDGDGVYSKRRLKSAVYAVAGYLN